MAQLWVSRFETDVKVLPAANDVRPYGGHMLYLAAAPQPAVAAGWQSIETAPKDGSYLLLWEQYSDAPFVGYWSDGSWSVSHEHVDAEGGWDGANVVDALSMPITHWMPLPAAPGPADGESNE